MAKFLSGGTLRLSSGEIVGTVLSSSEVTWGEPMDIPAKCSMVETGQVTVPLLLTSSDTKESVFTELMRMSESKTLVDGKNRVLVVDSFSSQSVARRVLGAIGTALDAAQRGVSVAVPSESRANFIAAGGGYADINDILTDKDRRYAIVDAKTKDFVFPYHMIRSDRSDRSCYTKRRSPADEKRAKRKASRASRRKNRK